jgi:GNAT superfamily N-acetyltransferase
MVAVLASARLEPGRPALEELGLHEVRVSDERPWPGRIGWYPQDAPPGYAHRLFGDYTHQVIALARGDTITSHIEWYPMAEAGCVALWDLAVAQADRGAGLGSYLLDKGLWTMAQQGYRTVELHTHTTKNALAFEMYRRRGFQVMEKWIALQKEAGG